MKQVVYDKFSVVIPAFNEAKTIGHVIEECLKVKRVDEVIVVDDGSTDGTEAAVMRQKSDSRLLYIKHRQNKGKGAALKTGFARAKNEVILFLDADLKNITGEKIMRIAWPVLRDEVDVSRATFRRARGRVTEYAVKPMMRVLFPNMNFEQPISGQVCAKKAFLQQLDLEKKYGVDIGILFDAIHEGQRIVEVDIGRLEHKANSEENIAEMARQVLETMIQKAGLIQHKYKLVIFTLDETLVRAQSLRYLYEKLGLNGEVEELQKQYANREITFRQMATRIAGFFRGKEALKIEAAVDNLPLTPYAKEVITALRKRKFEVAIISSNFSPIVLPIAKKLGVEVVDCVYIDSKDGKLSGHISQPSKERWIADDGEVAFDKAFNRVLKLTGVKAFETIMVANSQKSIPLQKAAGLSIAYRPKDNELKKAVDKTINVLAEILAIVE